MHRLSTSVYFLRPTTRPAQKLKTCKEAINSVLPVLGILMGVGMFIQIMTLTGVRGLIVTSCISLPNLLSEPGT